MSHIKPRVAGVGMVPFSKPSKSAPYDVMAPKAPSGPRWPTPASTWTWFSRPTPATSTATRPAASGRSTASGQTGIPVVNVNNNCSTGRSALLLARQAVESGAADCVLAFGFEQMEPGRARQRWAGPARPARATSSTC